MSPLRGTHRTIESESRGEHPPCLGVCGSAHAETATLQAEVRLLHRVIEALARPASLVHSLREAFTECVAASGLASGALYLHDGDDPTLRFNAHWGANRALAEPHAQRQAFYEELCQRGVTSLLPDRGIDASRTRELLASAEAVALLAVPMIATERCHGLVLVTSAAPLSAHQLSLVTTMGRVIGGALAQARASRAGALTAELHRAIMDSAEDAIGIAGFDGIVRECNRGWEKLLGRTREQMIGSRFHEFIAPQVRAAELAHIEQLPQLQRNRRNVKFVRPDGAQVEAELVNSVAEIAGELVYVAVARDATERNLLEAQLRQAQKIEAVGQLAGGVAHDFNNILAVILANCDFLLEDLPEGDARRIDVEQILTAGQRAVALTRQLTAFSRKQVLEPRVVSLNAAVSEVWKMLRRIIGEDIELVTALDEHAANAFIDVAQLEQVLLNLAVNARDAMPEGGALTLRTCNAEMGDDFVATHPGARVGRYVVLSVTDTGTGMSADVQSHMFEPFFTTKEKGKGTGLGLATVYGIVKQSGGYISVESQPGRGSVFTIYLPRVDAPAEALALSNGSKDEMAQGETILILEDELMVQQAVARVLRERGYRILVAGTPEEAVALSREHAGTIDLLLSDVVLPGMSGPAVAASLLLERPRMTALFMSGFSDHVSTPDGAESPAFHFIQKPFTPTAIAAKLRALLGSQSRGG